MDSQTHARGKPAGDSDRGARARVERSDLAASNHRSRRNLPAVASRGAAGTGARVPQPAGDGCHGSGISARLRGFEFFLSSFPNVGGDDTLPVEGSAPTI